MSDKTKVLIIEDAPFIQNMFENKFKDDEFEVIKALTGEEGYTMLTSKNPDLVLFDLLLPDIDGMVLLEKIKSEPKFEKLPIIIITNVDSQENMQRAVELGIADYFVKARHSFFSIVEMIETYLKQIAKQKTSKTWAKKQDSKN